MTSRLRASSSWRTNWSCLRASGPTRACAGTGVHGVQLAGGRQRQCRQSPQRLHPLGSGAVGLVQDVVDLAEEARSRSVETCWAAELSDRADRSWRPSTGSQVAGAITGPARSSWAAANSADARCEGRLGGRRGQRRRVGGGNGRPRARSGPAGRGGRPTRRRRPTKAPHDGQHDDDADDHEPPAPPSTLESLTVSLVLLARAGTGATPRPAGATDGPGGSYRSASGRRGARPGTPGRVPVASPRVVLDHPRGRRARHPRGRRARPAVHPLPAVGHRSHHGPGPGPTSASSSPPPSGPPPRPDAACGRPFPAPRPGRRTHDRPRRRPGRPVGIISIPKIALSDGGGRGHRRRAAPVRTGPLPGHAAARRGGQRGHRRPPDHVPPPLLRPGRTGARRPVDILTVQGLFVYHVTSSQAVDPTDVAVVAPTPTPTLTLTTCNPRYSASQRLVVQAAAGGRRAHRATTPARSAATAHRAPTAPAGRRAPVQKDWWAAIGWGLAVAALAVGLWAAGPALDGGRRLAVLVGGTVRVAGRGLPVLRRPGPAAAGQFLTAGDAGARARTAPGPGAGRSGGGAAVGFRRRGGDGGSAPRRSRRRRRPRRRAHRCRHP